MSDEQKSETPKSDATKVVELDLDTYNALLERLDELFVQPGQRGLAEPVGAGEVRAEFPLGQLPPTTHDVLLISLKEIDDSIAEHAPSSLRGLSVLDNRVIITSPRPLCQVALATARAVVRPASDRFGSGLARCLLAPSEVY